jgi:20S proteasome subunit beta 3
MSQNPFKINGGAVAALTGDKCVAIASDKRLGVQYQTVATNFQKVYRMQDNILMGLSGLASDCLTFYKKLRYKLNMYRIREGIEMTANTFSHLVGTTLYEHR